jgi:outer membrane cobalamin receptor
MKPLLKSVSVLAALASSLALAAEPAKVSGTNGVSSLPTVIVTASPITQEESVSKDGAESVIVSRDQLALLNAQDIQTALRQVPGVTISRYSPIGSYGGGQGGSVYIRGLGTARPGGEVRMYTDGAPRESGMWGHPLMDSMPIDFAESISVQKSPHSARYSGTFGAVDVETRRRREQGCEGETDLVCGRYGTFIAAGSAGLKDGPVNAYGGMSYKHSDGYRDHNKAILKSAFARLGADLSESERLGFTYQRTDSRVEDPGVVGRPTPRTDRFDLDTDLYNLRFDTDRENIKGYSLVFFERGNIDWWQDGLCKTPSGAMDGNAHTEWLNFGFRNYYDWNVRKGLWLTAGLDVSDEHGETETRNLQNGRTPFAADGRLTTVSPYLGLRYDIPVADDWTLTPSAGTRYYFHSRYDGEWSPTAALTLDWKEKVQVFVNGSRGVHYPGVYTRAVSQDYARDTLNAEVMDYLSGGAKVVVDATLDVMATVFHAAVRDRIDKTSGGYINAGDMRSTGVELSGHWRPTDALAFFAGLAYTHPETSPVSRLPRWTATAGGTWRICDYLKWTVDGQFLDRMYAYSVRAEQDALNLTELKEGFILNTRLAVPLESLTPVKGEIFVSFENVTESDYEYYPGYPMGDMMWYVGCKLRF